MKHVKLYTDGACKGNPGPGGWGALLVYGSTEKELSGHEENTTNNRMELRAAIEGLKALKNPCRIDLYTDSSYMRDGMMQWRFGWEKRGWKKVANVEIWQELIAAAARHDITWHWVRGHDGHPENERVDVLASDAALEVQKLAKEAAGD
jgi:ribonuclease HI